MSLQRSYTRDEIVYTSRAMKAFGGSFAASIGDAMIKADSNNIVRLLNAFPELVEKYGPGTAFYKHVVQQEML